MKTKQILCGALAALMLASSCFSASAANITTDGGAGQTLVTYGMNQGFLVTIPTDFTIDDSNMAKAEVSATNVIIAHGTTLEVSVSGYDYVDKWELIDTVESDNRLEYTIGTTVGGSDIINNSVVLSVPAGTAFNSTTEKVMHFTVIDTLTKAGIYKDTLTFTVAINGDIQQNSLLVYNQPYRYDFGEDYFVDYVFQNDGYMTVYNYASDLSETGWGAHVPYEVVDNKLIVEGDTEFPLTISDDGHRVTLEYDGNVEEEYVLTPTEVAPVNRQFPFMANFEDVDYSYFIQFYDDGARLDIRDDTQYSEYPAEQIKYYDTYVDISGTGLEWDRIEVHPSGNLICVDEATIAINTSK